MFWFVSYTTVRYLTFSLSFNIKDNSLLTIYMVLIMKSHKEPLKYILFDKIEIITCYVLIYPLYLHYAEC